MEIYYWVDFSWVRNKKSKSEFYPSPSCPMGVYTAICTMGVVGGGGATSRRQKLLFHYSINTNLIPGQPNLPVHVNLYRPRVQIQAPWPTTITKGLRSGLSLSLLYHGNTFGCLHHGHGGRWGRHVPTPLVSLEQGCSKTCVALNLILRTLWFMYDFPTALKTFCSSYFTTLC